MRFVLAFLLVASTALAQTKTVVKPTTEQLVIKPTTEQLVETHRARLWTAASPALRVKLAAPIKTLLAKSDAKPKPGDPPVDLFVESRKLAAGVLGNAPATDIDALAALIMAQAAREAQDDLKTIMEQVKKQNEQKAAERALLEEIEKKLAAAQERYSKFQKVLSNILKKTSDTDSSIIGNMK